MVVVVDGGKQEISPRKRKCWLSLAGFYLIKQGLVLLADKVIVDNCSNRPDCGYWILGLPNVPA